MPVRHPLIITPEQQACVEPPMCQIAVPYKYPHYISILEGESFDAWWERYVRYFVDYRDKEENPLFTVIAQSAPERWYSRWVSTWLVPTAIERLRKTGLYFYTLNIDYETLLVGFLYGLYVGFRHWAYHDCKTPEYRPGESLCNGITTHSYMKHRLTHVNAKKYWKYDRRRFYRKLLWISPFAFGFATQFVWICHLWSSVTSEWSDRLFPMYWMGLYCQYYYYEEYDYENDYMTANYNKWWGLYPLLYVFIYSTCRNFYHFCHHVPFERVMYG